MIRDALGPLLLAALLIGSPRAGALEAYEEAGAPDSGAGEVLTVEDPRLFARLRDGLMRPVVAGLDAAQRPLAKLIDEAIYRVMRAKYPGRLHDATPQMNAVLTQLAQAVDQPSYPWRLIYVDDDPKNLISASYGTIYVFGGLLDLKLTEAELAGVLAHEMAHVLQKHTVHRVELAVGIGAAAAAVSAALLQLGPGGAAAIPAGLGLEWLALMKRNRNEETQADACAVDLLRRSPFGCMTLPQALQRLYEQGSGVSGAGAWKYLEGHPPTADRIAKLEQACLAPP